MSEPKASPKPRLPPNEISRSFWDAAREHRLAVLRCDDCGTYVHWPQVGCWSCGSGRLSPAELRGRGTVYSFTIVHHVFNPAFGADVPYNIAIVELDEQPGLRMLANIECPNEDLRCGMAVEVCFEEREGYTLPQFRPAGDSGRA